MIYWKQAILDFRRQRMESGRSASTDRVVNYQLNCLAHFAQARGILGPAQLTRQDLDAFQRELQTVPSRRGLRAPNQVLALMQRVLVFLSWCETNDILLVHPDPHRVTPPKMQVPIHVPTVEQVARLLAQPRTDEPNGLRDRVLLELLYSTGIRRGECRWLDLGHVDLAARKIALQRTKNSQFRLVPIGDHLARWLGPYFEHGRDRLRPAPGETALFVSSQNGGRICVNTVQRIFSLHAQKAGLQGFTLHSLRHACATHLLEAGMDIRFIQELLGHRHLQSTSHYARVTEPELTQEHRATHPRP